MIIFSDRDEEKNAGETEYIIKAIWENLTAAFKTNRPDKKKGVRK
jgi:hypothetical protein